MDTHKSRATLPDGRQVILTWERGDCLEARSGAERVDLRAVFGSAEARDAWLGERTEDEAIGAGPLDTVPVPCQPFRYEAICFGPRILLSYEAGRCGGGK